MHCQKCRSPLRLDGSLDQLNPAAFDLLIASNGTTAQPGGDQSTGAIRPLYPPERKEIYDEASQNDPSPVFKRNLSAPLHGTTNGASGSPSRSRQRDNPAMSFVMLSDSQVVPPPKIGSETSKREPERATEGSLALGHGRKGEGAEKASLSHQMETTARLFEILSSRSDIDHPICVECTELLVEGLQQRLRGSTRERDAYVGFLKKVNAEAPTEGEVRKAEEDLGVARREEAAAFAELQRLEREKADVDDEIAKLEEEARQLDSEEEKFWRERNAFALTLSDFQNERDGVNLQYDHDSRLLERLQRTNVYNDTFCIGHDGFFGTINSLRLGRLASQPVEWAEINAAWGQTLLLLATISERLGFDFEGYKLKPMGSTSKIDKIEPTPNSSSTSQAPSQATTKVTSLELFSSGDLPLGRMFLHRRFDSAMVAFLDCLRQLGDFVEHGPSSRIGGRGEGGLKLPYEIRKDRIGDASIKLGFNQDEAWTRACKYTLTCCKFLLAHASNVGGANRRNAT
ncbi:MAG: hypothetical protein M1825_006108 [Sarcosagium campestre]|nr:MAG: hypothetical protein M1825_006108 [Sarcosagium campestre]